MSDQTSNVAYIAVVPLYEGCEIYGVFDSSELAEGWKRKILAERRKIRLQNQKKHGRRYPVEDPDSILILEYEINAMIEVD